METFPIPAVWYTLSGKLAGEGYMWIYLGVASAVFLGLYDVCKKHALKGNAVIPVLFFSSAAGAAIALPVMLFSLAAPAAARGVGLYVAPLAPWVHGLVFVKAFLVCSSWISAYFAMKHLPISVVSPIRASGPFWTIVGALLIFHERLSLGQWGGIALIIGSYLWLSFETGKEGISFHKDKWVVLMFLAALLGAASALYDKFLLQRAMLDPVGMQAWFSVYMLLIVSVILAALWWPRRHGTTPFVWRWTIPMIGVLLILADFVYFRALADGTALIIILSAIRRSSVVLTFVVGSLVFGDVNRRRKGFALLGVLTGVLLILISKR